MLLEPLRVICLSPLIPGFQIRRLGDEETCSCPQESWVEKQIYNGGSYHADGQSRFPGAMLFLWGTEGREHPHPCGHPEVSSGMKQVLVNLAFCSSKSFLRCLDRSYFPLENPGFLTDQPEHSRSDSLTHLSDGEADTGNTHLSGRRLAFSAALPTLKS